MTARRASRIVCASTDENPAASAAGAALARDLERAGYSVEQGVKAFRERAPDLFVVLGGDGYLMECLRDLNYPATPVFGVNFGSVGFLMNTKACLPGLVKLIDEWRFQEEAHAVLEAAVQLEDGSRETLLAFNDFVVERMTRQALRLEVLVDGVPFNRFAGDGFVLSTAAGSTAYNLAAGGPVVHPAIQAILITPLYPHRASPFHSVQFSTMVPLQSRLTVHAGDLPKRGMRVVADGRQIERAASVDVADSGRRVRLLRPAEHQFIKTLARKFIGERP